MEFIIEPAELYLADKKLTKEVLATLKPQQLRRLEPQELAWLLLRSLEAGTQCSLLQLLSPAQLGELFYLTTRSSNPRMDRALSPMEAVCMSVSIPDAVSRFLDPGTDHSTAAGISSDLESDAKISGSSEAAIILQHINATRALVAQHTQNSAYL